MVRPPCCDKLNVKKGLWTADEDAKILAYISKHGTGNWTSVPKKAGLSRCGKSCRLRWTNYLRPDLKHENFTPQEEELIVRLHSAIGSRWSIIAQQLPGRTDNDVKNYWNTKLRKKLSEMGIDPVTHKPFSQIFADYGNIGGIPKPGNRIGSLNRDLKIAFCMKLEKYRTQPEEFMTTLVSPKTEPIMQDTNNHPLDLLTELQAITMVTEFSNCTSLEAIPPHIFVQNSTLSSSSSSSSSSTCSSSAQEKSQLNFSWRDFLLEDAFVPVSDNQEQENLAEFTSKNFEISQNPANMEAPINGFQASFSSNGSFVENILDQENEMLLEFPDLLEEPFYY